MATIVPRIRREELHAVMQRVFTAWYGDGVDEKVSPKLQMVAPPDLEYDQDTQTEKAGEYTLNPHTICINWELVEPRRIKVLPVEAMIGKTVAETGKHVVKTYGRDYHILGIEYWEYVFRSLSKVPVILKTDDQHHFFGSIVRTRNGRLGVPGAYLSGYDSEEQITIDTESIWNTRDRVVLLEK